MRLPGAHVLAPLVLAVAGCFRFAPVIPPPPRPLPPQAEPGQLAVTRPAVERHLAVEVARLKLPSLAFGVVTRGGLVYFVGLGERDGEGTPVTVETVYRIGSITKTVTGLALLQLRDAGKLSFDDPVAKHLPEIAGARAPTADAGPIRIRHLVTHTSGLPKVGELQYGDGHELSRLELRQAAQTAQLEFAPGTRTFYSNLAMALAGPIIARVSAEPFRAYMDRHVLGPLGMTRTVWDAEALPPGLLARGYYEKDGGGFAPARVDWHLGAAEAMGGLFSSVADLSRYVAFQLSAWPPRDGDDAGPLRRSSVRESHFLAGFTLPVGEGIGINWFVRDDPVLGHMVFHSGAVEGYHAMVWMLPERGVGVIALGPGSDALDGIARRALEIAVGDPRSRALSGATRIALGRVIALLRAPDRAALDRVFAPAFLQRTTPERVLAMLAGVRDAVGNCGKPGAVKNRTPQDADVELPCDKRRLRIELETETDAPFLVRSLLMTPR